MRKFYPTMKGETQQENNLEAWHKTTEKLLNGLRESARTSNDRLLLNESDFPEAFPPYGNCTPNNQLQEKLKSWQ